jgi:hypothetical protein
VASPPTHGQSGRRVTGPDESHRTAPGLPRVTVRPSLAVADLVPQPLCTASSPVAGASRYSIRPPIVSRA